MQTKNYSELRSQIRTGDLFFSAADDFISGAIRLFTRSRISHVGIFVWLEQRLFIAEAVEGKGVVLSLASSRLARCTRAYWGRPAAKLREEKILREMIFQTLGERYDYAGAVLSLILPKRDNEFFCSEWAAAMLGLEFPASERGVTPDDLARVCSADFVALTGFRPGGGEPAAANPGQNESPAGMS